MKHAALSPAAGVICEFNPFHNGHARLLRAVRGALGNGVWYRRAANTARTAASGIKPRVFFADFVQLPLDDRLSLLVCGCQTASLPRPSHD